MRVALLVTDLENGGTPLRLARLALGLRDAGIEVEVGCLAPPGPVSGRLEGEGIRTFAAGAKSVWDLAAIVRLAAWLRGFEPDVVHSWLMHANTATRLVCRALRIPVICGTATIEVERRWHLTIERLLTPLEDARTVNSAAVAEHVESTFGIERARICVLPPIFAARADPAPDRARVRQRCGIPSDAFTLLWAGRFDAVKRIDIVVDVLGSVGELSHLLLVGDGPERPGIERLVAARRLAGRAHFTGWLNHLDEVVAAADLLIFPSRTEGMPNVVLEALRGGLPVVGSDIPAMRELAAATDAIVLVASDSPEPFARKVGELQRESTRLAAMSQAAHAAAEKFAAADGIAAATRLYSEIIAQRRTGVADFE